MERNEDFLMLQMLHPNIQQVHGQTHIMRQIGCSLKCRAYLTFFQLSYHFLILIHPRNQCSNQKTNRISRS